MQTRVEKCVGVHAGIRWSPFDADAAKSGRKFCATFRNYPGFTDKKSIAGRFDAGKIVISAVGGRRRGTNGGNDFYPSVISSQYQSVAAQRRILFAQTCSLCH
jgi:hypothetical protein